MGPGLRTPPCSAYTLPEVIIASVISSFLLAGILSTFLLIGRTGLGAASYAEMNVSLRHAVERFNQDVRHANDLRWTDSKRLTLLLPATLGPSVTYAYEPARNSSDPGNFTRQAGDAEPEILVEGVAPDFAFSRFRLPFSGGDDSPQADNDLETKQLEVRLRAVRSGAGRPAVSQLALSARCVMRNKTVGQ